MKIKLDENIPLILSEILSQFDHDVQSVHSEGLSGVDDNRLWTIVQKEKRFLITQDLDFSDIRKFLPGTHSGVLLVRFRNPGRLKLIKMIKNIFAKEKTEDWQGCFLVLTENKLRIRSIKYF